MDVKRMLAEKSGVPVEEQRLIFAGKQLEDERSVMDYNLFKDSTMHLVQRHPKDKEGEEEEQERGEGEEEEPEEGEKEEDSPTSTPLCFIL